MSGSTFGSFEIGRRAIHVQQKGAHVSGQNIANANTEGYTRQIQHMKALVPAAVPGVETPPGYGVEVSDIERIRSEFYDNQIITAITNRSYWDRLSETLGSIETIFLEPGDMGINTALSDFFDAWQEVSVNPESYAVRISLREQAETLINVVGGIYERLDDLKFDLDKEISATVNDINGLAREIAELNKSIMFMQAIGKKSNEMLDERDKRLQELSEIINIRTIKKDNGGVEVLAGGRILVQDDRYFKLHTEEITDEDKLQDQIFIYNEMDSMLNITGGKLKGLLQSYNNEVFAYQRAVDELVFTLVLEVNALHREGSGLEGSVGVNFFEQWEDVMPGEIAIDKLSLELGAAKDENITGLNMEKWPDYNKLLSGNYTISTGVVPDDPPYLANAEVAATYSLNSDSLVQEATVGDDTTLNSSILFEVTKVGDDHVYVNYYLYHTDKAGNTSFGEGVKKLYTGGEDNTLEYSSRNEPGDILESLTLDLNLADTGNFSAGDKFVVNVAAAGAADEQTYSLAHNGDAVHKLVLNEDTLNGQANEMKFFQLDKNSGEHRDVIWYVTIDELVDEPEAASFSVEPYQPQNINDYIHRAVKKFRISSEVRSDLAHIAAAESRDAVGDGANALSIARLRDAKVMQGDKATFHDYFRGMIAELGVAGREAERMTLAMGAVEVRMREHQESVSGVSLDDEMLNLIQFQHSYNAAAKFLSTIDEMLEVLINNTGR